MEIIVGENKQFNEIEAGDIFVSHDGNVYSYVKDYFDTKYVLINIITARWIISDKVLSDFEVRVKKSIESGKLTHYPKSMYNMNISFERK